MWSFVAKAARWLALCLAGFVVLSCVQVMAVRWIDPPFSAYMVWDFLSFEHRFKPWLSWSPASRISPNLALAVLASEDQRFYEHNGFDWEEIQHAVDDSRRGKRLRGASTITMQTARNLFLWSGRSWVRKGLEAWYSVLLELFVPKNRILEIYLNIAEWGPGIYGAPLAARTYFNVSAADLTRDQAARLAVVLPSPERRSPLKLSSSMESRKRFVLRQMRNLELQDWPKRTRRPTT